jgi:hypothetical protein
MSSALGISTTGGLSVICTSNRGIWHQLIASAYASFYSRCPYVTRAERLLDLAHDLDVLLRHRLVLQAEVGERALVVEVDDHLGDLAAANIEDCCAFASHFPDLQAARPATRPHPG